MNTSTLELVTPSDSETVYNWLKAHPAETGRLVIARLGDINVYAKLPRRNDASYKLVYGFGFRTSEVVHWSFSLGVFGAASVAARGLEACWNVDLRHVVAEAASFRAAYFAHKGFVA